VQRANSYQAAANPDLPQDLRDQFKTAGDKADAILGMQDAQAKKAGLPQGTTFAESLPPELGQASGPNSPLGPTSPSRGPTIP
jgi:hypothetical protein